jgi:hypothetical protein
MSAYLRKTLLIFQAWQVKFDYALRMPPPPPCLLGTGTNLNADLLEQFWKLTYLLLRPTEPILATAEFEYLGELEAICETAFVFE